MNNIVQSQGTDLNIWDTPEKIQIIKNQLTKDLTDIEFKLFVEIAKSTGLNPLKRQIYAIKRGYGDKAKMTIQTSIDGYRSIAMRSGLHMGTSSAIFEMRDDKFPISSKVIVKKLVKGHIAEFEATAYWDEYAQFFNSKDKGRYLGEMWQQYPKLMLAKCAEALALRRAFPEELQQTYIDEEINPNVTLNNSNHTVIDIKKENIVEKTVEEHMEELKETVEKAKEFSELGNLDGMTKLFNSLDNIKKKIITPTFSELKKKCLQVQEEQKKLDNVAIDVLSKFDAELVDINTGEIL